MKNIVLKNIPDWVYKILELKAKYNNHTIDEEIIKELKKIVNYETENKNFTTEEWLNIAKENRNKMNFIAMENEINEFKNNGRP